MVLPNEIQDDSDEVEPAKILSPFVPGTNLQFAWDATSLENLKRCPRLYQYVMIENWRPKGDSIHLRWGLELHHFIEDYEIVRAQIDNHNEAIDYALEAILYRIEDWNPEPEPGKKSEEVKTKRALIAACIDYADHYEMDPAITVILQSGKPAVEVSFNLMLDYGPEALDEDQVYVLCGHLDKIVKLGGELYVMDHKTTTSTPGEYYFRQFDVHNQMSLYTWAAQQMMKTPIKGVIIDAVCIKDGYSIPVRSQTLRSDERLKEWEADTKEWLRAAERYAAQNYWPQNDTSCDKYGGCRFREVCSKSLRVRERWLQSNFTQEGEPWNPLKPR